MVACCVFFVLLLTFRNLISQQFIDCKSTYQCRKSYLVCLDDEKCDIDCSFPDRACQYSIISCPDNAQCNINCSHPQSCNNAQIRAEGATLLNLQCNDETQSCQYLQIYCPQKQGQKHVLSLC